MSEKKNKGFNGGDKVHINEIWISKLDSLSDFSLGFPTPSDYHCIY